MGTLSNMLHNSAPKTRVLLFSKNPSVAELILKVLNFHHKHFDFLLANGHYREEENDFVIFETSEENQAASFQPNIALISADMEAEKIIPILKNVIPGGIVIYPDAMENEIENSSNYFRRLSYNMSEFQKNKNQYLLNTEMGSIPLQTKEENLVKNLDGIKLLCQQFGVMEEDFYEPVMEFE